MIRIKGDQVSLIIIIIIFFTVPNQPGVVDSNLAVRVSKRRRCLIYS